MPAPGSAKAVSDYEHLSKAHLVNTPSQQLFRREENEDPDFLPLKPSKMLNSGGGMQPTNITTKVGNLSANNATSVVRAQDKIGLTQMLDDFGHLQMMNRVPIPTAWSPSMVQSSNPALLITPEKSLQPPKQTLPQGKENFHEPQTNSRVPVPVAWSPGMVVRPNPALVITPDKTLGTAIKSGRFGTGQSTADSRKGGTFGTRGKEKHSVRFDLPSASSGEETLDLSQENFTDLVSQSPITLRGQEMDDNSDQAFPAWKSFTQPKAYDPSAYSDDSTLDESAVSPRHTASDTVNDIENLTSDRLADKLQELLQSSASNAFQGLLSSKPLSQQSMDQPFISSLAQGASTRANLLKPSSDSPSSKKVMSAVSIPCHPSPKSNRKTVAKKNVGAVQDGSGNAGPAFIRAPASPYDPAGLPDSHVIRESAEESLSKNNYSFPFDVGAAGGDTENAFARPEYNSTLRVRGELDELCRSELDVERAVATALVKSEDKRTELNEKASVFTNRMSNQFRNLVDLDPSVDSLCSRVVQMRTSKARAKKLPTAPPTKSAKSSHTPPDLLEFLPPDLQKESPDFSLPGVKPVTIQLRSAPHDLAFELYKHNRVWQGIKDY